MTIEWQFQFLVIVLSFFLAIFLLLGIIFLIKAIQIATQLKEIAVQAQNLISKAEHIGEIISKAAAPVAIGRFLNGIVGFVKQKGGKKKGKDE